MRVRIAEIEKIIGYTFKDKSLLEVAFTHSSYVHENGGESNEKLEFLGDSVLNFVIAELLYLSAMKDEGAMTVSRASIVSREPLSAAIERMGLIDYLRLGVGISMTRGWSDKFRSNLFEAVLGAIYLDGGMENAKHFVYNHLGRDIAHTSTFDYKSKLQEYKQAEFNDLDLVYKTEDNGEKAFVSRVYMGGKLIGEGTGRKKKLAEREAAKSALCKFGII